MAVNNVIGLLDLAEQYMYSYGREVVENRALPDWRDGLKPVQRRLLWVSKIVAPQSGPPKKCARVVGETLGKYHPHGDQSVYGALVNMHHATYPLIEGHGNFGNKFNKDNPAAYRYTECRVSKFASKAYLDPEYLAVTPMHDNYDGEEKEPLYLPCLVPAILMNDSFGIAVGLTGGFPSMNFDGVVKAVEYILDGNKLTAKKAASFMHVINKAGGVCVSTPEEILAVFRDSDSSIRFIPKYEIDEAKRTVTFTQVPNGFTYPTMVKHYANPKKKWSKLLDRVDDMSSIAKPHVYIATFKRSVPRDQLKALAKEWAYAHEVSRKFALNVTERVTKNDLEKDDEVKFDSSTIPNLLHAWVDYRIDLEKRMQRNKIEGFERALHLNRLYLRAIDFVDKIIAIIKKESEPAEKIAKLMKISLEDANLVLDITLRRLTKLSVKSLKDRVANLEAEIKKAKAIISKPNARILSTLNEIAATL